MTEVIEATAGKIRCLPIQAKLKELLTAAADQCGIDVVRVISGGQPAKGTPGRRTGSTRHDLGWAADLQLEIGERSLSFVKTADLPFFEAFVAYASQLGATGIGAGVDYMGPLTLHVGYGDEAVWGAGGKSVTAPKWLRDAFAKGKARRDEPLTSLDVSTETPSPPPPPNIKHVVVARSGLNVRSGPNAQASIVGKLPAGAHVWSAPGDSTNEWWRIDLQNDGLFDGFVFAAYLTPA